MDQLPVLKKCTVERRFDSDGLDSRMAGRVRNPLSRGRRAAHGGVDSACQQWKAGKLLVIVMGVSAVAGICIVRCMRCSHRAFAGAHEYPVLAVRRNGILTADLPIERIWLFSVAAGVGAALRIVMTLTVFRAFQKMEGKWEEDRIDPV